MPASRRDPIEVLVVAVPETAGSALYGMVDVLSSAGWLWQAMARVDTHEPAFRVRVVATTREPFRCGNAIPVTPDTSIHEASNPAIVVVPELWLGPDEAIHGCHGELVAWLGAQYRRGAMMYSACSGTLMLAETGLLDGVPATSHWGYEALFRREYPHVQFRSESSLVFAEPSGRIVTAGGTTSWHDLALHIIARHVSPGEAVRVAKVYLMKTHDEGQRPFTSLVRNPPHGDSVVSKCQSWLVGHLTHPDAVAGVVAFSGLPERTIKRRFKAATGTSLIEYLQNLRVEKAKGLLEEGTQAVEAVSVAAGYEDASFFRRLFKRCVGVTPGQYRKLFGGIAGAKLRAQTKAHVQG